MIKDTIVRICYIFDTDMGNLSQDQYLDLESILASFGLDVLHSGSLEEECWEKGCEEN